MLMILSWRESFGEFIFQSPKMVQDIMMMTECQPSPTDFYNQATPEFSH
jgi:hypothetical protein